MWNSLSNFHWILEFQKTGLGDKCEDSMYTIHSQYFFFFINYYNIEWPTES